MIDIALAMLVVFASAKLLSELFERLGQPGIVGEILAGLLIGPHLLGWMHPSEVLNTLSELGVMFLLFRVGLEVKASELLKVGGTALTVAILGVIAPFILCGWVALLWRQSTTESMFVGAAMVATSVGITAQVLSSKGLLDTHASRIILGAAVIDDVLGLIVLALVSSSAKGKVNWLEIGITAGLASGFVVFIAVWGRHAVGRIVPHVQQRMQVAEAQFALAMVLLFGLAALAQYAGVAAIIGAFLAGMALSETVDERVHTMTAGVAELLVPFFLAGIGMSLNPATLMSSESLWLFAALFAAAVVSKLLGCGLGAIRDGRENALRVGVGMIPRGEVGMVVAQLGRKLHVIPDGLYGIIVLLSVTTTLAAPPLLKWAFSGEGESNPQ